MMKLCLVGSSNSIHIQRWSRWFVQRGHDVYLITTGTAKIEGVKSFHLKKTKSPINFFLRIIKTIKIIRGLKPNIINAHYASGTESFAVALSQYHPFIISVWGSDVARDPEKSYIFKKIVKYVLKNADIVHIGDQFGKERLKDLGCNKDKIVIIPWGVELDKFKNPMINFEKKKTNYIVTSVNPWEINRNIDILIKAIPTVTKKIKNIKFILIGGGSLEQELRILAKQLCIESFIDFIGRIPHAEMPKYFSISDVLVDTCIYKNNAGSGIGVANMEAMASGVPILLSEREYLRKVGKSLMDEPWYCSIVYDAKKPEDLAEKIIKLLTNDSLRKKISDKEIKVAKEIGDWDKNMEFIEKKFIQEIASCM